ncbi:MAG: chitinase, partial [Planctomycetes bacterium]|nr:chitinase [Planctomycetota bacterium]
FEVTVDDGATTASDSVAILVTADDDAPTADAGPDQTVAETTLVTLTAAGSSDPEGQALSYSWTQTAGPAVTLSSTTAVAPTFSAPDLLVDTTLTFEVTVDDGTNTATDSVEIVVTAQT